MYLKKESEINVKTNSYQGVMESKDRDEKEMRKICQEKIIEQNLQNIMERKVIKHVMKRKAINGLTCNNKIYTMKQTD